MRARTAALLIGVGNFACAQHLPTLPPSDHYRSGDLGVAKLDGDERAFIDRINKELAKYGQSATPGAYEMDLAALVANIRLSKRWHGSGQEVADEHAMRVATESQLGLDGGTAAYLYPVSDEPDDNNTKSIHWSQRFVARGIPLDFSFLHWSFRYSRVALPDDDLERAIHNIRPLQVFGKLKVGVALLANGADNARIFTIVLRDERLSLTDSPPRRAKPGERLALSGEVFDHGLSAMKLGLLEPDGRVEVQEVTATETGHFVATVQLPESAGVYLLTLARASGGFADVAFNVPLFVGVAETPWPLFAPPDAPTPDGSRDYAKRLASAIDSWRSSHGLPVLTLSVELCKAARQHAEQRATEVADARTDVNPAAAAVLFGPLGPKSAADLRQAGFDPKLVATRWGNTWSADVPSALLNFPGNALAAMDVGNPESKELGVGVVMVARDSLQYRDQALYTGVWMVTRPPAPPPAK